MVTIDSRRVHDKAQEVYDNIYNNHEDFRNWHRWFTTNWWYTQVLRCVWVNWNNPAADVDMMTHVAYNACEMIAEEEGLLD